MSGDDSFDIFLSELKRDSIYFYRVYESVNTFEEEGHYSHKEDFRNGSLEECRAEALKYYEERLNGFESGKVKFHYSFETPDNFKLGENAAYTLVLSLIQYFEEDDFIEYPLLGEDEETCTESRQVEAHILSKEE